MSKYIKIDNNDGGWIIFWWILLCAGEPDLYDKIYNLLESLAR